MKKLASTLPSATSSSSAGDSSEKRKQSDLALLAEIRRLLKEAARLNYLERRLEQGLASGSRQTVFANYSSDAQLGVLQPGQPVIFTAVGSQEVVAEPRLATAVPFAVRPLVIAGQPPAQQPKEEKEDGNKAPGCYGFTHARLLTNWFTQINKLVLTDQETLLFLHDKLFLP